MAISFILFGIYMFLFFQGRKEPDKNLFKKAAGYLVKKSPIKEISKESVRENLKILHPLKAVEKQIADYYKEKLSFVLTVVFLGNCLVFFTGVSNWQTSTLKNNRITRNSYGEVAQYVKLLAAVGESKKEIVLQVSPIKYDKEQIEAIFTEIEENIRQEMLLENESFDKVTSDLYFPASIEGYPVEITYTTNYFDYVDDTGKVTNEELTKPLIVEAQITLSYEDYTREFTIPFTLYPKEYTEEEALFKQVEKKLLECDKEQNTEKDLILPNKVADKEIVYTEIKEQNELPLFLLVIGTGIVLYVFKDKDLEKQVTKRRKTLMLEYPEFISKFTLLTGAGMPIKAALKKLAMDYREARAFTGYDNAKRNQKKTEETIVYITETGNVYHYRKNCTHLKLTISRVNYEEVGNFRNEGGEIYKPCEKCGKTSENTVYITKEGNRYHSTISCSGLKRTIDAVFISEVGNKSPCSRCGSF